MKKPIFVTKPTLPPLDEYVKYLEEIWDSKILTNNGPMHKQFEKELAEFLGVPYVSLFANGTLALVTALQTLRITGEVITTPYSFVATSHSLLWNNIKPVFVDIEDKHYNLDPEKIEAAITQKTTAILPVHVYGNPARVNDINTIAEKYGLKVIYDAAHAFGVKYQGKSILNFGDLSIVSFHATKVFNTFEGGAIVSPDLKTKKRIDYLKNFGFADEITVTGPGINSKMNEMQAAMGLLQLKYHEGNIIKRKNIVDKYRKELYGLSGISFLQQLNEAESNFAYFPIFIDPQDYGKTRDDLYFYLKNRNVNGRRYFYPLISTFPMYRSLDSARKDNLPIANEVADKVICLPIYPDLSNDEILYIVQLIKEYKG